MPESWSFTQQGAGAGGGEVSPGSGSSGFTSRAVITANSLGQLVASSNMQYDSTQGFLGIGTTAPSAQLDVNGSINVSTAQLSGYLGGGAGAVGISFPSTAQMVLFAGSSQMCRLSTVGFSIRANGAVAVPTAALDVISTVSGGNALLVRASTLVSPVLCIQSTGATAKLGFWTTVGTTQPAAYTTGTATTVRTLPSTITTVAGLMSAPEREEFNKMAGALNSILLDFRDYGLLR